jgi:hypothetical protein
MAGFTVAGVDVQNKAGNLTRNLWDALEEVRLFKAWLDDSAHNAAYTATLGISGADDAVIRAAFTDMDKLRQIAHALATQGAANDFFFNAKALTGTGWSG